MIYAYFQLFPTFFFIFIAFNDFYSSTVSKQNLTLTNRILYDQH